MVVAGSSDRASTRELAVLIDGPWAHRWYWRDELEAMQAASRAVGYPDEHPSAVLRCYQPAAGHRPHPSDGNRTGREWRYRPPTPAPAADHPGQARPAELRVIVPPPRQPTPEPAPRGPATSRPAKLVPAVPNGGLW